MKGSYLRANYRTTGGQVNISGIGGGIPLSSAAGGAGTDLAYGGFLWFSYALSFGEASAAIAAGFSNAFGDSTYGTMSLYYGSTKYDSGYKFFPINIMWLSYSDFALTDNTGGDSAQDILIEAVANSGSIWRISGLKVSATGSCTHACSVAARLLIMGFIVSSP